MNKKYYSFATDEWKENLVQAYSFRFTETPDFTREGDHITTRVNPEHREGFDNISLLSKEKYSEGVKATLRASFDAIGCPEIILVKNPEKCADGAVRYGECFEIVLWKNGVNVWRHFMNEEYKCHWHLRLGLETSFAEKEIHELTVEVRKNYIEFSVGGIGAVVRTEDLFEDFHIGLTACEGIVRLYDFCIEDI